MIDWREGVGLIWQARVWRRGAGGTGDRRRDQTTGFCWEFRVSPESQVVLGVLWYLFVQLLLLIILFLPLVCFSCPIDSRSKSARVILKLWNLIFNPTRFVLHGCNTTRMAKSVDVQYTEEKDTCESWIEWIICERRTE
jgi:hypothetical protein